MFLFSSKNKWIYQLRIMSIMLVISRLIFLSFSFCLLFPLISTYINMHRSLYIYKIHYRRRKKIIDSKQLCSMYVHIDMYIYMKNRFLSIIIDSQCYSQFMMVSFSEKNSTNTPTYNNDIFSICFYRFSSSHKHRPHISAHIFKRGMTLLKFQKSKFAFLFYPRQLLDKWQNQRCLSLSFIYVPIRSRCNKNIKYILYIKSECDDLTHV